MDIIKADIYRLVRCKGFWISIIIFSLFTGFQVLNRAMYLGFKYTDLPTSSYTLSLWPDMAEVADNIAYFLIPIIVIIISADFSNRTIINCILPGGSRVKLWLNKWILCVCLSVGFVILYYSIVVLSLSIKGKHIEDIVNFIYCLLSQMLSLFSIISFYVLIAILSKNTVATVTGCILLVYLIPGILSSIKGIIPQINPVLLNLDVIRNIRLARFIAILPPSESIAIIVIPVGYTALTVIASIIIIRKTEIR